MFPPTVMVLPSQLPSYFWGLCHHIRGSYAPLFLRSCWGRTTLPCCFCLFIVLCFPTFLLLLPFPFLIGETSRSLGARTFLLMCLQCLAQHSPDLCWWILATHEIQTINNPHSCCIALPMVYIRRERVALNLLTVRIIQVYFWQRTFKLPYSEKLEGLL